MVMALSMIALVRYLCVLVALPAFLSSSFAVCAATEGVVPAPEKIELRVVYFGHPGTPRAKDFAEFLNQHFSKVGQGDLDKFRETDAADYDVTLLDYDELKVISNRIQMPKVMVSREFARPTVTIGATGALVCQRMGLKTGYL